MIDRIVIQLLENKADVLACIKKLATQANLRPVDRTRYIVRLINIARRNNLL